MIEDAIKHYATFNTKGCPYGPTFGYLNDQSIPSNYYDFLNDANVDGNNITGATVDYALPNNKVVEYAVVQNDEDIEYEIIIDDYDSLDSIIEPLQNEILEIEGVGIEN